MDNYTFVRTYAWIVRTYAWQLWGICLDVRTYACSDLHKLRMSILRVKN